MKLEDLARQSADQVRMAAESMPVIPIDRVRRNHRIAVLAPAGALAIAGFALVAITTLTGEPTTTVPVATDPTTPVTTTQPSPVDPALALEQYLEPTTTYDVSLPEVTGPGLYGANTTHSAPFGDGDGQIGIVTGSVFDPTPPAMLPDGRAILADPVNGKVLSLGQPEAWSFDFWSEPGLTPVAVATGGNRVFVDAVDSSGVHHLVTLDDQGDEIRRIELGSISPDAPATTGLWTTANRVYWVLGDTEGALTWRPVADMSGVALNYSGGASVGKPDGFGGYVWQGFNSLVRAYIDGSVVEWRLPEAFEVEGYYSYEEGILAVLRPIPDRVPRLEVVVSLQADGTVRSMVHEPMAQVTGRIQTTMFDGNLFLSFQGEAGAIVQVVPLDGVRPLSLLGPVDVGDAEFLTMTQFGDLTDDAGNRLGLNGDFAGSWRRMAWDGDRGVVYIDGSGALRHATPESDKVVAYVGDPWAASILAVEPGLPTVVAVSTEFGAWVWIDLTSGNSVEGPDGVIGFDGQAHSLTRQGVTATIDDEAMRAANRGEGGEPVGDFELPWIVFTDSATGEVLSRLQVGTRNRPYLDILAFDGRRLIVARSSIEPANPPLTVFYLDMECADCTRRIETDLPQAFSLVGVSVREGPYAWAELGLPE